MYVLIASKLCRIKKQCLYLELGFKKTAFLYLRFTIGSNKTEKIRLDWPESPPALGHSSTLRRQHEFAPFFAIFLPVCIPPVRLHNAPPSMGNFVPTVHKLKN